PPMRPLLGPGARQTTGAPRHSMREYASRSIRGHWLHATTLRPSARTRWPISSRSSTRFGLASLKYGVGRALDPRKVGPDLLQAQLGQAVSILTRCRPSDRFGLLTASWVPFADWPSLP